MTDFDSLMTLVPSTLSPMNFYQIEMMHEHCHYSLIKYPDARWDAFLASYAYDCCSSITFCYLKSMELSVTASGEVDCLISLHYSNYMDAGLNTDLPQVFSFLGPISDETNWPAFCSSVVQPGAGGWPSATLFSSFVHNPPADSTNLLTDGFYGAFDTLPQYPPTLMALGSCSDKALLLWEDAYGEVFYSDFNCISPEPVTTVTYPWSQPDENNSCAMSANPDDAGMLLAWYQGGEIRCRHYLGDWNDFDHIVATGISNVGENNIDVCSVDDGYWIAWFANGAPEPELAFVPRDVVTGIEDDTQPGPPVIQIDVSPNPCDGSMTIHLQGVPGAGEVELQIYDGSGRLIRILNADHPISSMEWDCRDSGGNECSQGMYFVRAFAGGSHTSAKVILLRD
jgi:hypothetical protein